MTTSNSSVNMKFDNGKNFSVTIAKSGSPTYSSGSNGQIQYASAGGFAASPNLTFSNNVLLTQNLTVGALAKLGNVANVRINGGDPLQFLQTDGYGNLTWQTPEIVAPGNIGEIPYNDGNGNLIASDLLRWVTSGGRQLQAAANLTPYTDISYDLGSPSLRWRDLYLSGNTIFLDTVQISTDGGNVNISDISANNVTANNIVGNVVTANLLGGQLTTGIQPNITQVGNLSQLVVDGDVVFNSANNITANTLTGTIATPSQPQITEIGTLSSLSVSGAATVGALNTTIASMDTLLLNNLVVPPFTDTNMGNSVTDGYFIGDGSLLSNVQAGPWVANGTSNLVVDGNQITANVGGAVRLTVNSSGVSMAAANIANATVAVANIATVNSNTIVGGNANVANLLVRDGLRVNDAAIFDVGITTPNLYVQTSLQSDGILTAQTANITIYNNLGTAHLGLPSNIKIGGGNAQQFLQTDGAGNLSWQFITTEISGISNANSSVEIVSNGNVIFTVNGVNNVIDVGSTGTNISNLIAAGANISNLIATDANISNLIVDGSTNLGDIGNVTITGGNSGQFLQTDGGGNLTWATVNTDQIACAQSNVIAYAGTVAVSANGLANIISVTSNSLHADTVIKNDVAITGNLTVAGNLVYTQVTNLNVTDPIIGLGTGVDGPLTTNDGLDRGMSLHTYGSGATYTSVGVTAHPSNTIVLSTVTGITIGQDIAHYGAWPVGTTVTNVWVGNSTVETSQPTIKNIPNGSTISIGKDILRFIGWDVSDNRFVLAANTIISNNIISYNSFGNVKLGGLMLDNIYPTTGNGVANAVLITNGSGAVSWSSLDRGIY